MEIVQTTGIQTCKPMVCAQKRRSHIGENLIPTDHRILGKRDQQCENCKMEDVAGPDIENW